MRDNEAKPNTSRDAPDGSLRVMLAAVEWANSHWVMSPRIIEVATGHILLDLWNTDWDAEATFPRERCVRLGLRRYQSRVHLQAVLDLASDSFAIHADVPGPPTTGPLAALAPALEVASRRAAVANRQPAPAPSPVGPRQILMALQILIGALAAIAVLSFIAVRITPAPPRQLTPHPAMPGAPPSRRPGP